MLIIPSQLFQDYAVRQVIYRQYSFACSTQNSFSIGLFYDRFVEKHILLVRF